MDTRTKIVDDARGPLAVAAYFDPMVAAHTDRLRELAAQHGPLTVCICDPSDALLPARARAELAAACRAVERVVIGEEALAGFDRVIDERTGDAERRAALMQHVQARNG